MMAKSYACGEAVEIVGKAMQLHGGIGYTRESGIHAYLKRAALNRSLSARLRLTASNSLSATFRVSTHSSPRDLTLRVVGVEDRAGQQVQVRRAAMAAMHATAHSGRSGRD
jgi:hypothetical protein